ncbi:MAG: HigA family addiction module antidote protein [Acidobacteria bacterium]|nr:HigA family addiction module antidote protein [Acidobacteriota bacterium]
MSKSRTTTEGRRSRRDASERRPAAWNLHPGELLREEFLRPLGMSAYALARELHVPAPRINDIVLERRAITADTAVRLARFFGTTPEFWMNAQSFYEVRRATGKLASDLERIKPRRAA